MRVHHSFKVDTRVRIPHATPDKGTLFELMLRGWKSAATIGRRRNPYPDEMHCLVSSVGSRAPVYEAGGRTFESCTGRHQRVRGRQADSYAPTSHAGLAQLAEQRPPKPKVRGSIPWSGASSSRRSQAVEGGGLQSRRRKPASVRIGSSSPGKRALGCGRSSMAEQWVVSPLVPVRLRPATPKRMHSVPRLSGFERLAAVS